MALFCKLKKRDGTVLAISSPELIVRVQGTSGALELKSEVLYICETLDSLFFSLEDTGDNTVAGAYHIMFTSGETPTTIEYPEGLKYPKGVQPTIESNKTYEFHIINKCLTYEWYE